MDKAIKYKLVTCLEEYVTENKRLLIEAALNNRTRHITVVLEDIYQSQNASAVVRTCDCFGIQDVHVIVNNNAYVLNPRVVHGASKWVDIHQYNVEGENKSTTCINRLKEQGYKIVATSPNRKYPSIDDVKVNNKIALFFGTERKGLQSRTMEMADELVTIPMYGFTESFNLSVSAAICLKTIVSKLHKSEIGWRLSDDERLDIKLSWYKKLVNRSELIMNEFLSKVV